MVSYVSCNDNYYAEEDDHSFSFFVFVNAGLLRLMIVSSDLFGQLAG